MSEDKSADKIVISTEELSAYIHDAERYRYFKKRFSGQHNLIALARMFGCIHTEFLPSLDYQIDAARAANAASTATPETKEK